jgi:hypothetical protein
VFFNFPHFYVLISIFLSIYSFFHDFVEFSYIFPNFFAISNSSPVFLASQRFYRNFPEFFICGISKMSRRLPLLLDKIAFSQRGNGNPTLCQSRTPAALPLHAQTSMTDPWHSHASMQSWSAGLRCFPLGSWHFLSSPQLVCSSMSFSFNNKEMKGKTSLPVFLLTYLSSVSFSSFLVCSSGAL